MLLGILSDTHDRIPRTRRAVAALIDRGAQALIHCGDLTTAEVVLACGGAVPISFVYGNNDDDREGLAEAIRSIGGTLLGDGGTITLAGRRIAVTHGDSIREVNRLAYTSPDYLLYGHSHIAADERRGATRWINPGALHRARRFSVAVLDLAADTLEFVPIDDTAA